jgi:hypothetical protein
VLPAHVVTVYDIQHSSILKTFIFLIFEP